jgi:hypothetical protein
MELSGACMLFFSMRSACSMQHLQESITRRICTSWNQGQGDAFWDLRLSRGPSSFHVVREVPGILRPAWKRHSPIDALREDRGPPE